jgi:hypothetical protein
MNRLHADAAPTVACMQALRVQVQPGEVPAGAGLEGQHFWRVVPLSHCLGPIAATGAPDSGTRLACWLTAAGTQLMRSAGRGLLRPGQCRVQE